ncbi:MAG: hypothetical protein QOC99_3066, partial [Acidobacteriota bacterium]|nr:hypothetical protein [Acidobacteriota bacterium]
DGGEVIRDSIEGDATEAVRVGDELAARLLERGAGVLLADLPLQIRE